MDKSKIELLVDKKVAEAKLEVTEKRLHYLIGIAGAMLAIFGVFFPFWTTNRASDKVDTALSQMKQDMKSSSQDIHSDSRATAESLEKAVQSIKSEMRFQVEDQSRQLNLSTNKVDSAIQDMQKRFKELEGNQLRKPLLDLFYRSASLDGSTILFFPNKRGDTLTVKNNGDAPASNIRFRVYAAYSADCNEIFERLIPSDETGYQCAYEDSSIANTILNPKENRQFSIRRVHGRVGKYPALLKVFYAEQPDPRRHLFTLIVSNKVP